MVLERERGAAGVQSWSAAREKGSSGALQEGVPSGAGERLVQARRD